MDNEELIKTFLKFYIPQKTICLPSALKQFAYYPSDDVQMAFDAMAERGYITKPNEHMESEILITAEEFDGKFGLNPSKSKKVLDIYKEALNVFMREPVVISVAELQRVMRIGYIKAKKIIANLEMLGCIKAEKGNDKVLVTPQEAEIILNDNIYVLVADFKPAKSSSINGAVTAEEVPQSEEYPEAVSDVADTPDVAEDANKYLPEFLKRIYVESPKQTETPVAEDVKDTPKQAEALPTEAVNDEEIADIDFVVLKKKKRLLGGPSFEHYKTFPEEEAIGFDKIACGKDCVFGVHKMFKNIKYIDTSSRDIANDIDIAMGISSDGELVMEDLRRIKHIFVVGDNREETDMFLANILFNIMHGCSPHKARFLLLGRDDDIFSFAKNTPFLMENRVFTGKHQQEKVLQSACEEMDRRFAQFAAARCNNIDEYNANSQVDIQLPHVVIIMTDYIESFVNMYRLVAHGCKAGIHIVMAMHDADNAVAAMAYSLSGKVIFKCDLLSDGRNLDSRSLSGRGEAFFRVMDGRYIRMQCPIICQEDKDVLIKYLNDKATFVELQDNIAPIKERDEDEKLLKKVMDVFIEMGVASVALAQDKCNTGYILAKYAVNKCCECGYLSAEENSFHERKVLMSREEYNKVFCDKTPCDVKEVKKQQPVGKPESVAYLGDVDYKKPPIELLSNDFAEEFDEASELKAAQCAVVETLVRSGLDGEVINVEQAPSFLKVNFNLNRQISEEECEDMFMSVKGARLVRNADGSYGVEVSRLARKIVGLRTVMEETEPKPALGAMEISLGRGLNFAPFSVNLTQLPNLLIEGGTPSVRCNLMHDIILSLLCRYSHREVNFLLCDFSGGELSVYDGLPHMIAGETVVGDMKVNNALLWLEKEMDGRFDSLKKSGFSCWNEYRKFSEGARPNIVAIINEIPKVALCGQGDMDEIMINIMNKGHLVGVHLILSTQKPSVEVLSAAVRCNAQATVAFATEYVEESYDIIGCRGAESLKDNGDMIFRKLDGAPHRLQCAYVNSETESVAVCRFIKENNGIAKVNQDIYNVIIGGKSVCCGIYLPLRVQRSIMRMSITLGRLPSTLIRVVTESGGYEKDFIIKLLLEKNYIKENHQKSGGYDIIMTAEQFKAVFDENL